LFSFIQNTKTNIVKIISSRKRKNIISNKTGGFYRQNWGQNRQKEKSSRKQNQILKRIQSCPDFTVSIMYNCPGNNYIRLNKCTVLFPNIAVEKYMGEGYKMGAKFPVMKNGTNFVTLLSRFSKANGKFSTATGRYADKDNP
jgi:hypothetical protein